MYTEAEDDSGESCRTGSRGQMNRKGWGLWGCSSLAELLIQHVLRPSVQCLASKQNKQTKRVARYWGYQDREGKVLVEHNGAQWGTLVVSELRRQRQGDCCMSEASKNILWNPDSSKQKKNPYWMGNISRPGSLFFSHKWSIYKLMYNIYLNRSSLFIR